MDEAGDFKRRRDQIPSSAGPVVESGFGENFVAGVGGAIDEETMVGAYLHQGAYRDRDRQIDKMALAGEINLDGYTDGDDVDYPRLAYDLKRAGVEIQDDYDVREQLRHELDERREYRAGVSRRANVWGTIGMFGGYAAGASLDPINVGMMFVPGLGAARYGSSMARAGKAALWYGGTAAVGEAAIQVAPQYGVVDWKRHLGVNYTIGDSLTAVALTAGGSGVIGAGIDLAINSKAINNGFNNLKNRIRENAPLPEHKTLLKEIDRAQQSYNWHVRLYRREQVMQRLERLKAMRQQLNDTVKQRQLDKVIDEYNAEEFQRWLDEADMLPVESVEDIYDTLDAQTALFFPDEAPNDLPGPTRLPDNPKFDPEANEVIARMDEIDKLDAEELMDPDDVPPLEPDYEPTVRTDEDTGDPFLDFDEDEYRNFTPEQQEAYLAKALGEDTNLDELVYAEEIGLDGDGNVMTQNKTRGESELEAQEVNDALDEFVDCWRGLDG